jgi:hypothetical protein
MNKINDVDAAPMHGIVSVPPDPDCCLCKGTGVESRPYIAGVVDVHYQCDCTRVCQCGEERPSNLTYCASPGCVNMGCDSCDEVEWCCHPHDEADGDYFCGECQT